MKKLLYLDLIGGASGDMLMAALVDAGGDLAVVQAAIAGLGLSVELRERVAHPAGLRARGVDVVIRSPGGAERVEAPASEPSGWKILGPAEQPEHVHRPYRFIRDLISNAPHLHPAAKVMALGAFARLADAEATAHGVAADDVVFHEVGADDAIADIVGVAALVASLAVDEIVVSPVPLGRGLTRGAHGPIPLPGPAVLALLEGVPLIGTALQGETVTPTGAALIRTLADRFGPMPSMVLDRTGSGAGHREWPDRPNIVRALIGRTEVAFATSSAHEIMVEANLDDMSPQHFGALERALTLAGAVEVWSETILMKKGRLGTRVSAILAESAVDAAAQAFFLHSTTLGVRVLPLRRIRAERHIEEVETAFGKVRVKRSIRGGVADTVMPEHDDCERLAEAAGVPIRAVWEAALVAARAVVRSR